MGRTPGYFGRRRSPSATVGRLARGCRRVSCPVRRPAGASDRGELGRLGDRQPAGLTRADIGRGPALDLALAGGRMAGGQRAARAARSGPPRPAAAPRSAMRRSAAQAGSAGRADQHDLDRLVEQHGAAQQRGVDRADCARPRRRTPRSAARRARDSGARRSGRRAARAPRAACRCRLGVGPSCAFLARTRTSVAAAGTWK